MRQKLRTIYIKFLQALAFHEQTSRHAQLSKPPGHIDWRVVIIFVLACVILSLLNYYGGSGDWEALHIFLQPFVEDPEETLREWFLSHDFSRLARLTYWSGTTVIGYFLIPAILIRYIWKEHLSDYGLPSPGKSPGYGLFLALFFIMFPVVLIASLTEDFQSSYPFYQYADRSAFDFLAWQLVYAAQFFALEFFYRGFLIHGLKHRFGVYSIFISTIPYVMIHFGKPLPETLGSIIAGIVLGAMSYHYKSIWPGVLLHIAIAMSMDVFSLSAQGRLF